MFTRYTRMLSGKEANGGRRQLEITRALWSVFPDHDTARVLSGATLRSLLWVQVSRQALAPCAILPSTAPSMYTTHSPLPY